MRRFILIAAMVLASAGAQAADTRSLSTGLGTVQPVDPPLPVSVKRVRAENDTATTVTPTQSETPRYSVPTSEVAPLTGTGRNVSETPRYTTRPAAVDSAPPATASTTPSTTTPAATTPATKPVTTTSTARDQPPSEERYHPSPRRRVYTDRSYGGRSYGGGYYGGGYYGGRSHFYLPRWNTRRIVATLHRYGFYW